MFSRAGSLRSGPLAAGEGEEAPQVCVFSLRWRAEAVHWRRIRHDGSDTAARHHRAAVSVPRRAGTRGHAESELHAPAEAWDLDEDRTEIIAAGRYRCTLAVSACGGLIYLGLQGMSASSPRGDVRRCVRKASWG